MKNNIVRLVSLWAILICFGGLSFGSVAAEEGFDRAAAVARIKAEFAGIEKWDDDLNKMAKRLNKKEITPEKFREFLNSEPDFKNIFNDAKRVVAVDPSDGDGFWGIKGVLQANKVFTDRESFKKGIPSSPEAVELEKEMMRNLLRYHLDRSDVLYVNFETLTMDERLAFLREIVESSPNADLAGNAAQLIAERYWKMLRRNPDLGEADKKLYRSKIFYYADVIRTKYPDVMPFTINYVPRYMRKGEDKGPLYRGPGTPSLRELADDLVRVQGLLVGNKLPDVGALNIANDRNDVLANYRGKVLILDMWATWCGPCKSAIPGLIEFKKEMAGQPFEIIGVSADSELSDLTDFLEDNELPWTQWFATDTGEIMQQLGVSSFPTYFIVDAAGVLHLRAHKIDDKAKSLIRDLVAKLKG